MGFGDRITVVGNFGLNLRGFVLCSFNKTRGRNDQKCGEYGFTCGGLFTSCYNHKNI